MLKKLNLDGTRRYEIAVACNWISKMMASLIDGHDGPKSIGSEQGGIPKWDDFLVEESSDLLTHIQVKRNNTHFSRDPVVRGVRPKAGGLQNLSSLDESIYELSQWLSRVDLVSLNPKHRFVIEVPDGEIFIKNGLTVNHLRQLCNDTIQNSTNYSKFSELIANDTSVANIATWMKSWCGFSNDEKVLDALRLLRISRFGNEEDLESQTKDILKRYFKDIDNVYDIIYGLTLRTSSFVGCLTPRAVLLKISTFLLPEVIHWTHYTLNGTVYEKRGIHDKRADFIEHPSVIVPNLWNRDKQGKLKLTASCDISQKLPRAIIRLALHLQTGTVAHLSDSHSWNQLAKHAVGGTLGLEENDFDTISTLTCADSQSSSECVSLSTIEQHEEEASLLTDAMQREVWASVSADIFRFISELPNSELREAVEKRFAIWNKTLSKDLSSQSRLCTSMLHPLAEGNDIVAEFRVGPKTVRLISKGVFYLLIVSVAMTANDNSWEELDNALSVKVKANRFWSGPAGDPRRPRRFTDLGGDKFLAAEPSKVLVLSETEAPPSEIREFSLADDSRAEHLAAPKQPKIIVTGCRKFRFLVEKGQIQPITDYLVSLSVAL